MGINRSRFTPNRREVLTLAWVGSLAIVVWQISRLFIQVANPHGLGSMLGGLIPFGSVDAAPPPGDAPIDDPDNRLWIVNTSEGLLALDKTCTHLDCLLAWDGQSGEFFCPCHGSRFAQDGAYLEGPAPRGMDRYVVKVKDGEETVLAMTDVSTGAPLSIGTPEGAEPEEESEADASDATAADDVSEDASASASGDATIWVDKSQKIAGAPAT